MDFADCDAFLKATKAQGSTTLVVWLAAAGRSMRPRTWDDFDRLKNLALTDRARFAEELLECLEADKTIYTALKQTAKHAMLGVHPVAPPDPAAPAVAAVQVAAAAAPDAATAPSAASSSATAREKAAAPPGPAAGSGKSGKPSKADRIKDAKRRKDKQAAQDICKADIRQYTIIFEHVRAAQVAELAALEATVAGMQQRLPPAEGQRQPTEIDGETDTKAPEYLINLEMAFEDHDDTIFDDAKAVAVELGHSFHPGPAKKPDRQEEKASNAYAGDYSLLKDLRRASIVCDNIDEINATILRLEAAGIEFCRIKNRFDRTFKATELSAGYRDLQLNVRIPGTGLIWELQIHLAAIEKLKSQLRDQDDGSGRTGHQRYIAFRTIMERLA